MRRKKKQKPERKFEIMIAPSVARDLITVLYKFSEHKMELLHLGQDDQAERLLKLNLFREDVREAFENHTKRSRRT